MTARVACTFYRQDLFEANTKDFEAEYGYRLEFTKDTTWKNVTDMAAFFKKAKEAGKDVPYGYAQHQGSFGWTTQLDIQRLLFANGRWMDWNIDDVYGSKTPGKTNWGDEQSILMMTQVQGTGGRLRIPTTSPTARSSSTPSISPAISRCRSQYHEFAASIEDETTSRAAGGKTAYAHLPEGRSRHGSRMAARRSTAATAASAASASTATPPKI